MVFITLWLQLLGFSDFAASLLMALFALGSALGGLLGGAIGEALYMRHPSKDSLQLSLPLRASLLCCMDSTQVAAHLHVECRLHTQDTEDHHEYSHPPLPSQQCRSRLVVLLQETGPQRQLRTEAESWLPSSA